MGTVGGILAAIAQRILFPDWGEVAAFLWSSSFSLVAIVATAMTTAPTPDATLRRFYTVTRPFGVWRSVRARLDQDFLRQVDAENRRDLIATCVAVPWQMTLFLLWMVSWVLMLGLRVVARECIG